MKVVMSISVLLFASQCASAQWSTSTSVDSTLYVCPGFFKSILTYDDGSSVICGGLLDSRYAQQLDPFGYKIWPQPVEIINTPGTNSTAIYGPIDDGDGGIILWWPDHRGSEYGEFGPFNNAVFMQRVDKYGMVRWQDGGVQIDSVTGGLKGAEAVADGAGGIILCMRENDFLRTGASNTARTWVMRYDGNGRNTWSVNLDTSTVQGQIPACQPFRLGNRVMITSLKGPIFIDPISGAFQTPPAFVPHWVVVLDGDHAAFDVQRLSDRFDGPERMYRQYLVTRMSANWDSLWSTPFEILDRGDNVLPLNNFILPDKLGGLFFCEHSSSDSTRRGVRLRRITRSGVQFADDSVQFFSELSGGYGFNGPGEFGIYFTNGRAFKVDTTGRSMWSQDFTVIGNPGDAYTQVCASDNNGGGIVAYWSTLGGIYAQHTGRMGKVGVITRVVDEKRVPSDFALEQNYPNPFNPTTTIRFVVHQSQSVLLKIYDLLGRDLVTLVNERLQPGKYEVIWDGSEYASGVYFCALASGRTTLTKKMILLQ